MPAASLLPERISAKVFGQEELPGQYAKVGSVMHMLPVIAGGANAAAQTATMALGWSNSGESCHLRKTTHTRLIFRSNWRLQSRHYRELAIRIGRLL